MLTASCQLDAEVKAQTSQYSKSMLHSNDVVEDFCATLQSKIDTAPKQDIHIIMGAWNVKLDKDHETWGPTIGKHGIVRFEHMLGFFKEIFRSRRKQILFSTN